jgi:hypothetical protein
MRGEGSLRGAALAPQPFDHAAPVGGRTVLAQLPLAFQPLDREPETDDALELGGDELGRRIADRPRRRAR